MAMFCSNCGTQITEGGAFCYACGKPVSQTQPMVAPAAAVAPAVPAAPAAAVAAKKKSKAPLIIAGVAVLVLAFALVGLFTQGFGLFGDTEATSGSMANGGETPSPEVTPPATTPSPETPPSKTPTPETPSPSETPSPEVTPTPSEEPTPTPESPSPELPPNHISAEFLDLVRNGDNFYLSYLEKTLYGELHGDLEYHYTHFDSCWVEEARQGELYAHTEAFPVTQGAPIRWFYQRVHRGDDIEYHFQHRDRLRAEVSLASRMGSRTAGSGWGGLAILASDNDQRFNAAEYVGSGVGAINGVQMIYDEYSLSYADIRLQGMDTGLCFLVYLLDDKIAYVVEFFDGEAYTSYSFTEVGRVIPPIDLEISYAEIGTNIPPDIFEIDEYLATYTLVYAEVLAVPEG